MLALNTFVLLYVFQPGDLVMLTEDVCDFPQSLSVNAKVGLLLSYPYWLIIHDHIFM